MDQRQPAGAAAAVACLQPRCPRLNFSRSWQQGGGHSAPSSKLRASSRSLGRSRWLCSPAGGCGDAFLGRAGQGRAGPCRESSTGWPREVSRLGSSAPLTRTACASLSRTMTGYVRYLSTERLQTALRPLQSVVKEPAVGAMLAAPAPHPQARTQSAGWEQLLAPELAARGVAWGAAGRCPGKQGAGEGAGQGLLQEPTAVPGLTSWGISVDNRYSGRRRRRETRPFALLSCAPTAALRCVPPRSSCSPVWIKKSWATSCGSPEPNRG